MPQISKAQGKSERGKQREKWRQGRSGESKWRSGTV